MIKQAFLLKFFAAVLAMGVFCAASQSAKAAATIVIQNGDPAGVGFNDTTPVSPVGNNTGTTLGQQRLNAFQFAANLWGGTINSGVTITIQATWEPLSCSTTDGDTLGSAGTTSIFANFPNAPQTNTWYSAALANALAGTDLDPSTAEIRACFNLNIGNHSCY